ncbi:MAG TPA: serine/threonine-protein kinase [Polyangiaceae bacterium]|nr:serine/threonine-protein kinase [Polyangiaceae bacterium]
MSQGDLIAGKYRIEKVLGTGGMGVVVAATHVALDERVAIKFLLPEALANEEVVLRFAREARAAIKIKSEHIARVIDVGTMDGGAPYLVMEYLEGNDLSTMLLQSGPLPVDQTVEFVLQACEAVAEAHALGIVHRDLKPANLFCCRRADGLLAVKVLDFGISKVTGLTASGPDMGMTKTAAVMGSPLYMSPEQMQSSRDVDLTTDIWALGVIIHELLTGAVPFTGDTLPEVCVKIAMQPPASLRAARPDVPPAIEAAVAKCLEKDRANRFRNVAELALALAPYGPRRARASVDWIGRVIQNAGLSASAVALPPSSEAEKNEPFASATAGSWAQTSPGSAAKNRGFLWMAGAALVVIVGGSAALWLQREPPAQVVAPPPLPTTASAGISAPPEPSAAATPAPPPPPSATAATPPPVKDPAPNPVPNAQSGRQQHALPVSSAAASAEARRRTNERPQTKKQQQQPPPPPPVEMGGRL